jgi:hypothetical protein
VGLDKTLERVASQKALTAKVQRLASFPAKRRVAEIIADPQARELVQAMAEEELYFTFKEVGDHEGLPLLELASPEQRQYITDLDLWQKEEFKLERALDWVALLLALMPAADWAAGSRSLELRDAEKAPLLTWRTVLLSAFARGVLSSRFVPERLAPAEIRAFLEKIWEPRSRPSRVAPHWKRELATWLGGLVHRPPEQMEPVVADLSATLDGELGETRSAELERKYLETLFLVEPEKAGD